MTSTTTTEPEALADLKDALESVDIEEGRAIYNHTPEEIGLMVMENRDAMLAALSTPAARMLAGEGGALAEAVGRISKFCDEWPKIRHTNDDIYGLHFGESREAVLRLSDLKTVLSPLFPAPDRGEVVQMAVPADVAALVVASREAWETLQDEHPTYEVTGSLSKALEAFASRVCWDDDGGSIPEAHANPHTCGLESGEG
jgi:hypothetical protein